MLKSYSPLSLSEPTKSEVAWLGCAVVFVSGGFGLLGWWLIGKSFWLWKMIGCAMVLPALMTLIGGGRNFCWALARKGVKDPVPLVIAVVAGTVTIGWIGFDGLWWSKPARVPDGSFQVVESRGFGSTLKNARVAVKKPDGIDGHGTVIVFGPGFPRRELGIEDVRRAFSADCVFDLGNSGKMTWTMDPGTSMWKVEWPGFGEERWMLLK